MRIGIDIGGTALLAVACDPDGSVRAQAQAPTPAKNGGQAILDAAATLARQVAGDHPIAGVGVGAAGVVDAERGIILTTGSLFTGWAGTDVRTGLSARLGGVPVAVENDVNAFLLGELAPAGNPDNALAVTLGTGVGGALLVDGRLLHGGATGAGEIGHVGDFGPAPCSCGRTGHLEAYASGTSLAHRYTEATGRPVTAIEVAEAARVGDETALALFNDAGRCLGSAIAQAGGLLGIELAILGGGVLGSWSLLEKPLLRALQAQPLLSGHPVAVRRATLGERAAAVGAASLIPA